MDAGDEHRTVVLETVRCGDDSCHCSDPDGERHGSCLYRYQSNGGSLDSEYLGEPEEQPDDLLDDVLLKATIIIKQINDNRYYYWQWREEDSVVSKYKGPVETE